MNKQTLATVSVSFFVDSVAEGEKKYEDIKNVVNAYSTSLLQFSETTLPNLKKKSQRKTSMRTGIISRRKSMSQQSCYLESHYRRSLITLRLTDGLINVMEKSLFAIIVINLG